MSRLGIDIVNWRIARAWTMAWPTTIGSFDFETALLRPGLQAPPPVCLTWAFADHFGIAPSFATPLRDLLASGYTWGGVNLAFDMASAMAWGLLTPDEVFGAYERNQIVDLGVLERVAEIGGWTPRKKLSLEMLHQAYGLGALAKGEVRTSYEPLLGKPLEDYSSEQIEYAVRDAIAGHKVFQRQLARWGSRIHLSDVAELSRKAFWLYLTKAWGLTTDPKRVDILKQEVEFALEGLESVAKQAGLVRQNGSRDMKAIQARVTAAYDNDPPMTVAKKDRKSKKLFVPQVRTDKDTMTASGDFLLELLADLGSWKGIRGNPEKGKGDLFHLTNGTRYPIHTKYGLADTTRTTSSGPNVQNVRRAARKDCSHCKRSSPAFVKACQCGSTEFTPRQGIRECYIPRPGHCYVAIDHGGLELATLAQVIVWHLGRNDMASKLNRGEDLHLHVAAEILKCSYHEALQLKIAGDKELKNARNCGKVVNFGRPGGMSAPTLVLYAKQSYGIEMDLAFAERLIEHWERANPDGVAFLKYIRTLQRGRRFDVVIPGTTIERNQTTYCSAANCHFQGLGAVIESEVGWEFAKEIHLRGWIARMVNFIHDEFIFETPIGTQTAVARRAHEIMTGPAAQKHLPNVRIGAEYAAMIRWSKAAEAKFSAEGELLIHGLDYAA